jgi:hypothetical protein
MGWIKKNASGDSFVISVPVDIRVARFFFVQNTKTGQNLPNFHELKNRKMDQVSIKYTNIFHCKTLQNLPQFGFFV